MWKARLLKLLKLKERGILFKARPFDFIYVPEKHAMGLIVDIPAPQRLSVAFFPSLNNKAFFFEQIKFDPQTDVVLPSFENLIEIGHTYMKRESLGTSHPSIVPAGGSQPIQSEKHQLYGRLSSKFKTAGDSNDYDFLIDMLANVSNKEII